MLPILPWLAPVGVLDLAVILILSATFHITLRESHGVGFNLVLLILTGFVAYYP